MVQEKKLVNMFVLPLKRGQELLRREAQKLSVDGGMSGDRACSSGQAFLFHEGELGGQGDSARFFQGVTDPSQRIRARKQSCVYAACVYVSVSS